MKERIIDWFYEYFRKEAAIPLPERYQDIMYEWATEVGTKLYEHLFKDCGDVQEYYVHEDNNL